MSEFAGLSAIVTGGRSGIGAAVVARLLDRGARVASLDLATDGVDGRACAIRCDLGVTTQVNAAVADAVTQLGGLDIVVNNAGIGAVGDVTANDDAEWERVLNVNVRGVARVCTAAIPHLRRSPAAAIVNVLSIVATAGLPQRAVYAASKGAVMSLTLAMAADHIRDGIRVNAVSPATVHTTWIDNLLAGADDAERELAQLNARQPHGRMVTPAEVAASICFLASPENGSTTGTVLAVDGGMHGLRLRKD